MTNLLILVLGPSGIGKTTVLKHFTQKVKSINSVIMDNVAHSQAREMDLIGPKDDLNALINALDGDRERLLNFGIDAINQYIANTNDKPVIIDVGTGFLDAPSSLAWVSSHSSIAVMADSGSAFDRFRKARQLDISYEQYVSTQFSKARTDIYNKASIVLKTEGIAEHESAHKFACCVLGSLPKEIAHIALQELLN